jgi:C-terminal processing protease CtpA/Prc
MHQFLTSGYNLQVELEVHGDGGTRTLLLERRALPLPPMKTHLLDTGDGHLVAYLRLHYFTHEGTKKMAAAIREGEALGVDGYSMYAVLFVPPTCIDPSRGCMLELSSFGSLTPVITAYQISTKTLAHAVLDLRNNPGGVFEEAIAMAVIFLGLKSFHVHINFFQWVAMRN